MATLTLPTDTVLIDPDLYTFLTNVKTNVDNLFASAPVVVTDAASYAVLAANTGKLHVFPNVSQNTTATLPAAAAGLTYEFMYNGAAADASNHIITGATGAFLKGGVIFHDEDGDLNSQVFANGSSHLALTIVTPFAYCVKFVSDGTYWYTNGWVHSATTPSIA
jgi:hypothetical protein